MDALLMGLSASKITGMSLGSPRCKEYENMCDYNTVIKIPYQSPGFSENKHPVCTALEHVYLRLSSSFES